MSIIRIGSRESRLAVIQAELVKSYIEQNVPNAEVSIVTMKTTGDMILDRPLDEIGGKGLFVKELDRALLDGRTDISVHSLKDMPMELSSELPIIGFSAREDARDVLVLPQGASEWDMTRPVGCSGKRRTVQLRRLFPEVSVKGVRGNVQTRLAKLDSGEYGALILAAAGLKRLGLEKRITRYFSADELIPAAGQGILAVQGKKGVDHSYLNGFFDKEAEICATAERAFVRELDGGCSSPVAANGVIKNGVLTLTGLYCTDEGLDYTTGSLSGETCEAEAIGIRLARILAGGGK